MTTRVFRQGASKNAGLGAHGCALYAMVNGYLWASDGEVGPTSNEAATTAALARKTASGVSEADFNARGLTSREIETSLFAIKRRAERPALDSQRWSGVHVRNELIPLMVEENAGAAVAVLYSVFQKHGVGVGSWQGGHEVFIAEYRASDDTFNVADSLRTTWKRIKASVVIEGMQKFGTKPWGGGKGEANIIWKWVTYRTLMFRARDQRDAQKKVAETATKQRDQAVADRNTAIKERDTARKELADYRAPGDAALAAARKLGAKLVSDAAATAAAGV